MDARCPACHTPALPTSACDACLEPFDPLASAGACPGCAQVWDPLPEPDQGWSGELLRLARGERDLPALLARADAEEDERVRRGYRCEAQVWAGVLAERAGRVDEAQALYRAGVAEGVPHFYEHLWAALRLAGVEPRPPRPAPAVTPVSTSAAAAAAPPAPAAPASAASTLIEDLERLARLRDQGLLSAEEFARAKRRLLEG